MIAKHHSYNISKEFHLYPYKDGIKLIRPDNFWRPHISSSCTVSDILNSSIPMWFIDSDCAGICTNEIAATEAGFISAKDSIGKTMLDVIAKNDAIKSMANDKAVMKNNLSKIAEETSTRKDGLIVKALCIKKPWYDEANKTIGSFGCAIILDKYPLSETLSKIAKLGFLNTSMNSNITTYQESNLKNTLLISDFEIDNVYLTKQEIRCLQLLIRGKTFKLIGKILQLSPRTVEHYIENIKHKLEVKTKADLIEKVIQHIWPNTV